MNREEAWKLLCEWTESDSPKTHARRRGRDARLLRQVRRGRGKWGSMGLLHDMDYKKHSSPAEHPWWACGSLRPEVTRRIC